MISYFFSIYSSDDEKDNFEYFLTTEAGKDILKEKGMVCSFAY